MKCQECGHENRDEARFCDQCGHRLEGVAAPSDARSILEAERKRITALFSDISGYTAMTSKLDPEEVKEITSRVFDGVREVVGKYEGFIERFAGDGVLALFGVPKAHEDDPIRAVHAAREIHDLVESLSPRYEARIGRPLSMHSGVNTGLAVTADVNPEKGTHGVTGDAINVAARLSDLAQAREILVGPDTHRACQSHFSFQPLAPAKVKGKAEPIPIFRVLSAKVSAPDVRTGRQVSSEMVGRDSELDKLELQVIKAINGEGSVVNVIGEAGIGKSRLVAELKKRDVMKRVTLLEGRAISIGKNLSFHPIIDLLKQWAGIAEDDPEARAFEKIGKAIRAVHPEEANEIVPFVGTLMGMKLTGKHAERVKGIEGEGLEKLILKNVRELVIKGSELRPSVIIMEDLHWADTSSIELLASLYRLTEKYRIAFINVFRPGYFESDDGSVAKVGERLPVYYVEIQIQPLDKTDSEALINNMLEIKGLPYSIKTQIVERAGGNPFFIEEVVRSLIDEGAVIRKDGGFEVTERIDSVVIPPTINDVLMARIDRLEEQTRELVKVASVIGRSFFDRIIKDVADSIKDVDDRLAYLKDVQIIRDRTRMEELEYLFKHALAQEAAYESTLIQQRKALHLKVAQSIEKLFQDRLHEFFGTLAYHYGKGEDMDKAEEYMTRAGEEALRSSASSEALHYFKEALRLYEDKYGDAGDPWRLAMLERKLAEAYGRKAQHHNAVRYADRALTRLGVRYPSTRVGTAARLVSDLIVLLLRLNFSWTGVARVTDQKTHELFELVLIKDRALAFTNTTRLFCEMCTEMRKSYQYDLGRLEMAADLHLLGSACFAYAGFARMAELSLTSARNLMDTQKIRDVASYQLASCCHAFLAGKWNETPRYERTLFDACAKAGLFWHAAGYSGFAGRVRIYQGQFREAEEWYQNMVVLQEQYDFGFMNEALTLFELLVVSGRLGAASAEADRATSIAVEQDLGPWSLAAAGWQAVIQCLLYDLDGARHALTRAQRMRSENASSAPWHLSSSLLGQFMFDVLLLESVLGGDSRSSIPECTRTAWKSGHAALKNSSKFAAHRTWTYRLVGLYYWLIGKQCKAIKWWDKAIKEGERLGARPDLSRTYFEVGKRMSESQSNYKQLNGIDANGYLEKAGVSFEEMGLERDLEDLERVRMEM